MRNRSLAIMVGGLSLAFAGCGRAHRDADATAKTRQGEHAAMSTPQNLSVEDRLLVIVSRVFSNDLEYTPVSGWNLAISACSLFASRQVLVLSDAESTTPHGMKIYRLWAKDAEAYDLAANEDQPVGQVIVKESFVSKETTDVPKEFTVEEAATMFYAERDGKTYKADKPAGLFIMFKDDPATPDTDEGWVYGTVTSDGRQVTSSGRIKACVDCHRQARHDRVFGEKPKAE